MADLRQIKIQLKQQHQSQLQKLAFKSEADIEVLEVVREYMKSRAELEINHSKVYFFILKNTLRISKGYQKRWPSGGFESIWDQMELHSLRIHQMEKIVKILLVQEGIRMAKGRKSRRSFHRH
jgi:hypothetical protein